MSARALTLASSKTAHLRPFNLRKDLSAVADLVELCFQDTLDEDGRLYIRQMRHTAGNRSLVEAALATTLNNDMPPGGYVWEEAGRLIGNLSLIPIAALRQRYYLIANVAVHPEYRRRGIATRLTEAALERAQSSSAEQIWLQVDHKNAAAIKLYQQMGFVARAQRIGWVARPDRARGIENERGPQIRKARSGDWEQQEKWLQASYPPEVRWNLPLNFRQLQPGLLGSMQRFLDERRVAQWAAEKNGELLGVLSWQESSLTADRLWLASSQENEAAALPALLGMVHRELKRGRKLLLNYAAGQSEELFERCGFEQLRQLIWMQQRG